MFKNEKLLISNEDNFYLKQLSRIDVTENYINWLNDYEVVKVLNRDILNTHMILFVSLSNKNYLQKKIICLVFIMIKNILKRC